MPRATRLGFLASVLSFVLSAQIPLGSSDHSQTEFPISVLGGNEWSLNNRPNPNATDHLVFETVHSLLQQWPNTRMRNGHNIVPGIIPRGTLLYHGTGQKELPAGPEWTSTDPEHAYFFCWDYWSSDSPNECWYFTLATTRPLKIVYFDGSSAAKFPEGSLDAQDLVVWGEARPDHALGELQRIHDLCEWAKEYGLDGIVRMGMDFEVMLCDFSSGVRLVSLANLERPDVSVPPTTGRVVFEVMNAGSRHYRFPGETRVQLDLAGLVSFYDTHLVPSLVPIRASQERWDHRLQNISSQDLLAVMSRLEGCFSRSPGSSSGIEWKTLIQVIVDRFAGRLELTRHLLHVSATNPTDIIDLANKTQTQLRIMLTPYILFSATPIDPLDKTDLDWSTPVYKLCATTHSYFMKPELDSMTDSEKLILRAVRGTSKEICRVVTKMWAAGVYAGIDASLNVKESLDITEVIHVWNTWAEELNRLMTWLDWSVWVKCDPECSPEELCYMPTWPVGFPLTTTNLATLTVINPGSDEWFRPRPKCIRAVNPYEF